VKGKDEPPGRFFKRRDMVTKSIKRLEKALGDWTPMTNEAQNP